MTVKTINRSQLEHWGRSISTCVLKVGFHQARNPRGLLPSPHMDKKQKTEKKKTKKRKERSGKYSTTLKKQFGHAMKA